jgi:hypothetical protein
MNDFFSPSIFTSNAITNIVYSSYIEDYFIFFALLLSGYIALIYFSGYFLGYLISKLPYENKLFNFKKLLSFLVILPLLIILVKIILDIDSTSIFLEKYLFIAILVSLSTLLFIYSATKGLLKNNYGIIKLYKDYTFTAIIITMVSIFYHYNIDFVTEKIKNKIHKEMIYLKNKNDSDYRLSKLIVNYYVKSIDKHANSLEKREHKIINDFNTAIISSNKLIKALEARYKNKINIVDKEIDEEKLRLKSIYKEWQNNTENKINNLDKLSKKYQLKIKTSENNKDLIVHLRSELKLIKQKNSKLNIELFRANDLIYQNISDIKSKDKLFNKLSNSVKKDKTSVDLINKTSLKNSVDINNQIKEINKIKAIQIKLKKNIDLIKTETEEYLKTNNNLRSKKL